MRFNALGPSVPIHPSAFSFNFRPRQPEPESKPEPEPAPEPAYLLPQQSDEAPPPSGRPTKHARTPLRIAAPCLPRHSNQVANPPGHSTHPSLDDYPRAHLWPASETSPLPPFTTFLRPNLQAGPAQHQNSLVLVPVLDADSFPTSKPLSAFDQQFVPSAAQRPLSY